MLQDSFFFVQGRKHIRNTLNSIVAVKPMLNLMCVAVLQHWLRSCRVREILACHRRRLQSAYRYVSRSHRTRFPSKCRNELSNRPLCRSNLSSVCVLSCLMITAFTLCSIAHQKAAGRGRCTSATCCWAVWYHWKVNLGLSLHLWWIVESLHRLSAKNTTRMNKNSMLRWFRGEWTVDCFWPLNHAMSVWFASHVGCNLATNQTVSLSSSVICMI